MTFPDFLKYAFDFAFSGFWHWIGVYLLLSTCRLFSYSSYRGVSK